MFKTTDDRIGIREYISIILIGFYSKVTDSTPTLFFKQAKNAGWMSPIISAMLTFLSFLLILSLLKKYKNKGLIDIIYYLMGKYIGFIVVMILFISHMIFTITNTRSYSSIIVTLFFPRTSILVVYGALIGTSAFIAFRGLKAIGRSAWIMSPYIQIALISIVVFIWRDNRTEFLFPIAGGGIKSILTSGVLYTSTFSEIITYSIFFNNIRNYKEFKLASSIGLWISAAQMIILYACYIMMFDYPAVVHLNYLFHTLTRFIRISRFFGNLEGIFFLFWIIISLIRFSMYLYTVSGLLAYSVKMKKVEALVLPLAALVFILGLIPENNIIAVQVIRNINLQITSGIYVALPILLFTVSKLKGGCDN